MKDKDYSVKVGEAAVALRSFLDRYCVNATALARIENYSDSIALAFIPEFGSPQGLLLDVIQPPNYMGDSELRDYAHQSKMYYSQVNVHQLVNYTDADFMEAFRDWGYYGESPPDWYIEHFASR